MLARFAFLAALLLPLPARAQHEHLEFACSAAIERDGKLEPVAVSDFSSYDLVNPKGAGVVLPPGVNAIFCFRLSIVPFPDDYLMLRRGMKLYIVAYEDRPARVVGLLQMERGAPRYSFYQGEPTEREQDEIDAAIEAFPPI